MVSPELGPELPELRRNFDPELPGTPVILQRSKGLNFLELSP